MAITLIGTVQTGSATNGNDVTLTFDGSPAENDVVILVGGHGDNGAGGNAGATGYTEVGKISDANFEFGVFYKVMGATPDTDVTGQGDGVVQTGTAYASYMLRGVDTSNVSDTAVTTNTTPDAAFDSPSITTVTDAAWSEWLTAMKRLATRGCCSR